MRALVDRPATAADTLPGAEPSSLALSVVVPVCDEEGAVLPLLGEIRAALAGGESFEIVVVDDGSRDQTPDRLLTALRFVPELRVITHGVRCGQSSAIDTGIAAARGRWIATLDGDGQNDPADLPHLLSRRRDDAVTMICGVRRGRRDPWPKRVASRVANRVRDAVLGDGVADTGCGLKLFPRELYLRLPRFDHMHRFLPALARAAGAEVLTVDVRHRPRSSGRSKYGILDRLVQGLPDLVGVWWLTRRRMVAARVR